MITDAQKKACKSWAQNHKEQVNENNRKWRQNHKDKWNEISLAYRKRKAEEMKAKGMIYVYKSRTDREIKTIDYICRKLKVNEDEARRLLIDYEWNVKKILEDLT